MAGRAGASREFVVPVAVARAADTSDVEAHPGAPSDEYRIEVRRLTAANEELRAVPQAVATQLQQTVDAGQQLSRLAGRLGVDMQDLLQALDAAGTASSPHAADQDRQLSDGEAAALRRSGALHVAMPPAGERASTRTAARTAMLSAGALTVGQVARLLGRTEGRVRQRLAERTLLGVRDARGWRIPAFQFDDGAELPGWDRVMAALPHDVHPLTVERFLDTADADLELHGRSLTPREWLSAGGEIAVVVGLAAHLHRLP